MSIISGCQLYGLGGLVETNKKIKRKTRAKKGTGVKSMKRMVTVLLVISIVMSLCGCGSNLGDEEEYVYKDVEQEAIEETPIIEEFNYVNEAEATYPQIQDYFSFDVAWSDYTYTSKSYYLVDYAHNHLVFVTSGRAKGEKKTSYRVYDIEGNLETELHEINPDTGMPYDYYYKYAYSGDHQYVVKCAPDGSFSWLVDAYLISLGDSTKEDAIELLMETDYFYAMYAASLEAED